MIQKPEKIVFIRRKIAFHQAANNDPEVQDYFSGAYRAVGSYYKEFGKQYGSGLSRSEEKVLMPEITDYHPDEDRRSYRGAVNDYFRNINTKIPPEGLRLNIALEKPTEEMSETNLPVSIKSFLIWRHACGHPEVSMNLHDAERYEHIKFYIDDLEVVSSDAGKLNEQEDAAFIEYHQVADDESKVDQMLVLLGANPTKMLKADKKIMLKEFASIDPSASQTTNLIRLGKFINVSQDKDLKTKYLIEEMVRTNVLEKVGMKVLIRETGDLIGNDLKETTLWFLDKGNSKEVNVLMARYKEFAK